MSDPRVLLVEDDDNKLGQVRATLAAVRSDVVVARSYQSAMRSILQKAPGLIVLDMSLPAFDVGFMEDGGRTMAYGGREILGQLRRRGIACKVIVVTQFDRFGQGDETLTLSELDSQLRRTYVDMYCGSVYYNPGLSGWQDELLKMIGEVLGHAEDTGS